MCPRPPCGRAGRWLGPNLGPAPGAVYGGLGDLARNPEISPFSSLNPAVGISFFPPIMGLNVYPPSPSMGAMVGEK